MSEALTRDVRESDRDLTAAEDSIYLFMGDSVSVLLKQAHASWVQYRKLECDAIRVAFAQGIDGTGRPDGMLDRPDGRPPDVSRGAVRLHAQRGAAAWQEVPLRASAAALFSVRLYVRDAG